MVQYTQPHFDASFAALSDVTRRGVLEQLARADASITDLAQKFQMTLTGMKKHVGVLEQAGLVTTEKVGRVRTCRLGVCRLEEEAAWIERTREAQAKADAQRVVEIVRALKADGMELTPDDIRDIVIDAMRAANEYNMDTALMRPLLEGPAKPPAEKKDNSAKK